MLRTPGLESLERVASRGSFAIALLGFSVLLVIALATLASILTRWLLNEPLQGVRDLTELAIPLVVAASFPSGLLRRQNIAIRFLGRWLGGRTSEFLEVFGAAALLFFFAAMAWQFVEYAAYLSETGQYSWILEMPLAPWWAVAAALIVLCVPLQALVLLLHLRRAVFRRGDPVAPAAEHF